MRVSASSVTSVLVALLLLATLSSCAPAPLFSADVTGTSILKARSAPGVHHQQLRPIPLPLTGRQQIDALGTAWMRDARDSPRGRPGLASSRTAAPASPCPIPAVWNVTLPLLEEDWTFLYSDCQLVALMTCDSTDDCPANVTAFDYRTGAAAWSVPYSNSSNDVPAGPWLATTADGAMLFLQREVARNDTAAICYSLTAYARGGTQIKQAWQHSECSPVRPVQVVPAVIDVGGTVLVMWSAVVMDPFGGDYITAYVVLDGGKGTVLSDGELKGGVDGVEVRGDDGLLLVPYILNSTAHANISRLHASGELTFLSAFLALEKGVMLPPKGPVVMLTDYQSYYGVDALTSRVLYNISASDDILFPPFAWLSAFANFTMAWISFDLDPATPSNLLVNAVAINAATNQLVGIVAVYDGHTGKRVATSKAIGPSPGDGNVLLLQFVDWTDNGKAAVVYLAHHLWALNPDTLAVLADAEKPYGEIGSFVETVSMVDATHFSTITATQGDGQYDIVLVGAPLTATPSSVASDAGTVGAVVPSSE